MSERLSGGAEELLTLEEVSRMTRVPVGTLRWYRVNGRGPRFAKIGRRVMARKHEVEAWLDQQFESEAAEHDDAS